MNSTDLPITEWWDPAWDVYDVPGSPYDDSDAPHDVWWAAYEHLWMLRHVMTGRAEYTPSHFQHQLTTGSELCTCRYRRYLISAPDDVEPERGCRYHFPTGRCRCVWEFDGVRGHRIPNRACPAHWQPEPAPPAVPPCGCEYVIHLARVPLASRPYSRKVRSSRFVVATGFKVDLWCPHHGEPPRWTPADRPWETTLGPDETR